MRRRADGWIGLVGPGDIIQAFSQGEWTVEERTVLGHLEALAESLGVGVRYEGVESEGGFSPGGLCRLRDRYYIIVNSAAGPGERIRTIARALKRFDLSRVYVRPALRELIERISEEEE